MRKYATSVFHSCAVLTTGTVLGYVSFVIFDLVYNEQKSAFIDEIFHIPQAKFYCQNQWTKWDSKITTLPGLYLVSYFLLKPFHLFGFENFCSVYTLRLTNVIATTVNFFIAYKISCSLEKKYNKFKSKFYFKLLTALNVAVFPPLYFFTFLYYTDVWSTTFVLLMYYLHLAEGKSCKILGGISAFLAVLMRQTNIIWVGLMILDDVWSILGKNVKGSAAQDYKHSKEVCQRFFSNYFNFKKSKNSKRLFDLTKQILMKSYPHIIICVLFVTFVMVNKSIVLGDKQAHAVTFHPMQILYFLDFLAFFAWPFLISEVASLWKKPVDVFTAVLFLGFFAALSEMNKLEHPYLLADNRHLAFYLWKRIFGHGVFRRVIVPTYLCFGILLMRLLQKRCLFLFTVQYICRLVVSHIQAWIQPGCQAGALVYAITTFLTLMYCSHVLYRLSVYTVLIVLLSVCTILNLTPQYLFELRYFIAPFIFYRLQFKQSTAVFTETIFFVVINFGVIYLFLNRPFFWPNEPNLVQRFIW